MDPYASSTNFFMQVASSTGQLVQNAFPLWEILLAVAFVALAIGMIIVAGTGSVKKVVHKPF